MNQIHISNWLTTTQLKQNLIFSNGRATDLRILNYVHEVGSLNVPALFINGLQTVNAAPSCVKKEAVLTWTGSGIVYNYSPKGR